MSDKRDLPKPIINNRPIAFCAVALCVGVTVGALLRNAHVWVYIISALLLAVTIVFIVKRKATFACVFTFALYGIISFSIVFSVVSVTPTNYSEAYVKGVVTEVRSDVYDEKVYAFGSLEINGNSAGGKAIVYTTEEFDVGDKVGFYGYGEAFEYNPFDSYSAQYYYTDVRYKFTADTALVMGQGRVSVFVKIRAKIGALYEEYMGERAGGMALGIVVGDKSGLDSEVTSAMRASGLAHLTAVSGLHVGFMCSIIYFVVRLFGRAKRYALKASIIILALYGAITGFPPGAVRAGIMTISMLVALSLAEAYDSLNALSLSVLVIVMLNPRELFSLSFLMSASAVLGIICFYRPLRRLIYSGYNRVLTKLADAIAVSISANTFLIAVSACAFQTFSTYFLIANPVAVAYTSVVYSLLVPITAIAMIPGLGFLLVPFKYLMLVLYAFASFIESLPGSTVTITSNVYSALLYSVALISASRFLRLKPRYKIPIVGAFLAVSVILLFVV